MSTPQEIAKAKKLKQKMLKKYLATNEAQPLKSDQNKIISSRFNVKDNDQIDDKSDFDDDVSSSQSEKPIKKRRVVSSDQELDDNQKLKQKILQKQKQSKANQDDQNNSILKSKKLIKKFKNAFGIENDQELVDFIKEMKIQGMEMKELKKLLKSKKVDLKLENVDQTQKEKKQKKRAKKEKKKQKKQQKQKDQKNVKFQGMLQDSGSSDIEVPDHARTIYRNKDGTIKIQTEAEKKQKRKDEVQSRLAEWEKGMKKEDSDADDDENLAHAKNSVWDDPLKIWNQQNLLKPFQCKYPGPGNRFNIKPGHRWDGAVRGNGFEARLIQQQNLRKAKQAREHKQYLKNL